MSNFYHILEGTNSHSGRMGVDVLAIIILIYILLFCVHGFTLPLAVINISVQIYSWEKGWLIDRLFFRLLQPDIEEMLEHPPPSRLCPQDALLMELFAPTFSWIPVVLLTFYSSGAVQSLGGGQRGQGPMPHNPPIPSFPAVFTLTLMCELRELLPWLLSWINAKNKLMWHKHCSWNTDTDLCFQ